MQPIASEINGQPVVLMCAHWRSFPPRAALVGSEFTPEQLRTQGKIGEAEYARYKVWQKVCDLKEMRPDKCLSCPHARTAEFKNNLPVLVSLDRKLATPTIDLPTLETSERHRQFLSQITKPRGE